MIGFKSLEELRERREWVRLRESLTYALAGVMDEKGVKSLFKRVSEPFYWEQDKKPKLNKVDIEAIKKLFDERK